LESYRKAVYYDATHAAAHYCISLLLAARGELAEAEASAREALQWEQRPEMFLHFGLVLAKEGKTQEVLDSFEEACGLSRDPAAQRRAISETLLRMQEPGLASDVLRGPGGTP
jgi:tetratricopeptide (TPR) repeat protein